MAGYRELREDYDLTENEQSIEGTRAFIEDPNGTDSLPKIGAVFSNDYRTALCRTRKRTKHWWNHAGDDKDKEKIVCSFSTRPSTVSVIFNTDEDERKFTLGGEIITIDKPQNWTWDQQGSAVDQPLFLANVMGTFTRNYVLNSDSQKAKWIKDKLTPRAGTINETEFESFRIGSVLFEGITGGTQVDEFGSKTWVFQLNFTYRIIRGAGGTDYNGLLIEQDDWLYLWNKTALVDHGAWDKPKDAEGNFLYAKSEFKELFKTSTPR